MPTALHAACVSGDRAPRDNAFSVTELIGPARIRQLMRTKDVVLDSSDRLWALLGTGINAALDRLDQDSVYLQAQVQHMVDGILVTGTPDAIDVPRRCITDWKVCSSWTWKLGGPKEEWEQQLNCYAYLSRRGIASAPWDDSDKRSWEDRLVGPFAPEFLEVTMIFRDWSASRMHSEDYPDHWTKTVLVPMWPDLAVEQFLQARIKEHRDAEFMLPDCSDEERWHRAGGVAVMKKGNKRAKRVLPTEEEARAWAENKGEPGLYLETRAGKDVRCLSWCPARSVCDHGLSLREAEEQDE